MASTGAKAAARFFIIFFFITQTYADDKCSAGCQGGSSPKDGFIQGNTYVYSLEGSATIQLSGADKQETTVKLTAGATVVALGNCANLLKVTSLQITGNDGTKYQKPRDMEKLIRFTLQDGVLGSDICAEEGDSQRSLNIKRALLSLLQTAVKHNTEVDVFGVCPTTFSVNKEGNGILVRKNRDLNFCAHREQAKQDLLTYIYNPKSEIKNSHILQSDLRVDSVLKNGIVEKVEAQENYLYRPFSVGQAGVRGSVTTKLALRETNKGTLPSKCVVPKSIIFENPHIVNTEHSNVANLNLALNSATQSLNGHVQDKSAAIFTGLVRVMRVSNKDDILNVYKQIKSGSAVKDNNLAKKVFLDALFRTGTGDSIEVCITLVKNKELTPLQQKLVFLSLSAVRHASSNSLKAATSLLDLPDVSNDVFLGVGALAGAFCREHPCHGAGSQDAGVAALTAKLGSKLGDCKAASKKAEDLIVTVLKGIRNIHHLEDSVVAKLANCAADKSVRQRVRVAALETFSADACIAKLKATALDILKDKQQDSEVRIKAYLALLECPDSKVADEIKTLLLSEPVYQVGSFITSSIRNLKATANPSRQAAKETIGAIEIVSKFPLDARKFSQNYEFSYEVDTLGVGSAVEANVIFSQDSYLPRSANLNLTAEIFGRQINLIELGVRQGNLDRVIEEYFGPHGVIKNHTPQQAFDGIKKTSTNIIEKIQERLKGSAKSKRDVMRQISAFGEKLKTDSRGYRGNLDIDLFAKLFGTESIFLSLGDDQPASIEALIDRVFDFVDSGVKDAKEFSHELRHHIMFLDMELAYPTAFGLTLKLNLEGAATTKLNFGGNFDIKKIFKDPKNARVEIKVIPSANIKVSGTLAVDADSVIHGLKVVATLHTSTGTHLVLKTLEGGFDMQLGLPVEKQELVTATSEIFLYKREKGHQDVETKVNFDPGNPRKDYTACFDQLSAAVGLTLCGEVSVPWNDLTNNGKGGPITLKPAFPLNGQAKISFSLEKDQLSGYHIHGAKTNKNGQQQWELTLEAEGSKKDRKVSFLLDVSAVPQLYSVKAVMNSPIKYLEARAALVNNDKEKSISAGVQVDKEEYSAKAGFIQAGANTYKPVLDYKLPGNHSPGKLEGTVTTPGGGQKKITFNNVCLVTGNNRISINGFISIDKEIATDLKVTVGENSASLSGKVQKQDDGHGWNAVAEFHNDLNPHVDFLLKLERVLKEDLRTIDFSLVHGADLNSKANKVSLYSCLKGQLDPLTEYEYTNKFSYPAVNIAFEGKSEVNLGKKFSLELEGKYEKTKGEFELVLKKATKKEGDFSGKLQTKLNDKGFETEFKYDADSDVKGNFAGKLEINPGGKYEVSGSVNHKCKPGDLDYGLNGRYKASGNPDDYKIDVGVVSNTALYNSHLKLSVGSNDILDSVAKVVKEPNHSGTLKVIIKDILDAQGQFKVNPDKKGNGVIVVDLQKVGKKVKFESNFLVSGPQYNVAFDLFPNFGKDNANKISFSTVNKKVDDSFDSKNTLTINGDKTDLHFKKDGKEGKLDDGKFTSTLEIVRSSGKTLNIDWQRDFTNKDDELKRVVSGTIAYVNGAGKSPQKLAYNGRFSMNQAGNKRDGEHHLNVLREDGQDIDIKYGVKITPGKEGRHNFDSKFEVKGAICREPLTISTNSDFYLDRENLSKYDSKYRIKGTYGQKSSLDVTGAYKVEAPEGGDSKLENDVTLHLVLPFDKAHDIKITSSEVLVVPEDDDKYFSLISKNVIQVNAETYNYDANLEFSDNQGKVKISAHLPKQEPLLFETSYSRQVSEDTYNHKYNSNLNVVYGGAGKQLQVTVEGNRQQHKEGQFTVVVVLPENLKAKKILSSFKFKRPEPGSHSTDLNIDIDGKKYALSTEFDRSKVDSALADIKATYPEGKPARFYILAQKTGENQYKGDSKLENIGDFNMVLTIDAKLSAPEEFDIKVDVDAAKIKLNKIHFEAKSEPAGKAKKIQFFAKENGKNVLSGTTTYQSRNEGNKFIMEGSGSVKIREEQKTTSFQYIRGLLNEPTENGVEIDFNVALGEKNIVIEHKATNKEYKLSTVYCEEKKQCAHIEINNKLDTSVPNRIATKTDFGFDLRKLGFAPEFGLQTSSELERFKLPIHTLDIHLNQEKSKYHAQVYAKPVKGVYQTAVTLTTPDRVISLESSTSVLDLQASKNPFPVQHETVFYLNKNDPGSKTLLRLIGDYQRVEHKQVSSSGELVFSAPTLGKDLQISGKSSYNIGSHVFNSELVLDIFKKKTQKVVATLKFSPEVVKSNDVLKTQVSYALEAHVNGKAIGFDALLEQKFFLSTDQLKYNSAASVTVGKNRKAASVQLEATPSKQIFVVKAPSTEVIRIEGGNSYSSPNYKGDVTICLLQDKSYKVTGEVSLVSPFSVSVVAGILNDPSKVVLSAKAVPLKLVEVKAEHISGKKSRILSHFVLSSQPKQTKPELTVNTELIKELIEKSRTDLLGIVKKGETILKKQTEETAADAQKLKTSIQEAIPNVQGVVTAYKAELEKITEELHSDKALQQLADTVQSIIKSITKVTSEITERVSEVAKQTSSILTEFLARINEIWTDKVLPSITTLVESWTHIATQLFGGALDVVSHYLIYVSEFLEKHSAELKPLLESVSKAVEEFCGSIEKLITKARDECKEFLQNLGENIGSLPVVQMVKNLLQEYNVYGNINGALKEVLNQCKHISPTDELRQFFEAIENYLDKKVNEENVNDSEALKVLFSKLVAAFDSLISYIRESVGVNAPNVVPGGFVTLPVSFPGLPRLPAALLPEFSFLNYLTEDTNIDLSEVVKAYWPKSLNPVDLIPPYKLRGLIAGGQHIFTFDSRHLTFPGSCRYVLAQDAVDGNFSISITLDKGSAKAVLLADKSGNAIEVNDKGVLTLNGQKYGFPVEKSDTIAWKDGQALVLMTNYGAFIKCSYNLEICYVEVSGFYLGKLRGLLGDGNNEPFDDFRLPNGKISSSESEFGSAYALDSGCPAVKTVDHSDILAHTSHRGHHGHGAKSSDICNTIFGGRSALTLCDISVDIKNYRQACQHATSSGGAHVEQDACLIARAYTLACQASGLPISLPEECATCTFEGTVYKKDQGFEIKTPSKQADIVIAVETTKANDKTYKELVVPLVSQFIDELKSKKVDDVKVTLVGISPNLRFPILYDIDNPKLGGAKIDFKYEQRSTKWESPIFTEHEKTDKILSQLAMTLQGVVGELGVDNLHLTYRTLGQKLDWRPKAVKTIITVHSEPCQVALVPILQNLGSLVSSTLMKQHGIVAHLITPVEGLSAEGIKNAASIIGFNSEDVFVLGDKKRGTSNSKARSNLEYDDDQCIDYPDKSFGNVYSSSSFKACNAGQRKQFLQLASQTLVDSITGVSIEQECSCTTQGIRSSVHCIVKSRKDNKTSSKKK